MDFMSLLSFDTRSKAEINDPNVLLLEDCSTQIPELAGLYVYFDKMATTDGMSNVDCLEQFMDEFAQENDQLAAKLSHLRRLVTRSPDAVMKHIRELMQKKSFGQLLVEQYDGDINQLLIDAGLAQEESSTIDKDIPLDSGFDDTFDDSFVNDPMPENATTPAPILSSATTPEPEPTPESVAVTSIPEPVSATAQIPIPETVAVTPEPAPAFVQEPNQESVPVSAPKPAPISISESACEPENFAKNTLSFLASEDDGEEEIPSMDRVIYECVQSVSENTEATNKMLSAIHQIGKSLGITVSENTESVDRELVFGSLRFLDKLSPEVIKSAFIHCVNNKSNQKEIDAMAKVIRLVYTYIRKHVK